MPWRIRLSTMASPPVMRAMAWSFCWLAAKVAWRAARGKDRSAGQELQYQRAEPHRVLLEHEVSGAGNQLGARIGDMCGQRTQHHRQPALRVSATNQQSPRTDRLGVRARERLALLVDL